MDVSQLRVRKYLNVAKSFAHHAIWAPYMVLTLIKLYSM